MLEEQWVALGALDAFKGELVGRVDEVARQSERIFLAQRTQVDGHQGTSARRAAPRLVQRIALDARGHDQERRTVGDRRGHSGEMREHQWIGPVDVLDDHHHGRVRAHPAN